MHPNEHILTDFFTAFQKHNTEGMIAFYSPDIVFSDSIYGTLKGPQVAAMWHVHELQAKYQVFPSPDISADDHTGRAVWQAGYIYTRTGRHVLNKVHAEFRFVN